MTESKRKKKGTINEPETMLLLQRYSAATIVTLLQEVGHSADAKIDWRELVKESSTGISNPREYQSLWRHLAYREPLLEKRDEAEPEDDDSDLEFELDIAPAVGNEVSSEAAECVKVLMASKLLKHSGPANDPAIKAHSQANTIADNKLVACPVSTNNVTASLHKLLDTTCVTTEGFEGNDTATPYKKKRKVWTEEEEAELTVAVHKHGEGNWAAILKEGFKYDRTPLQLKQRWSILKKRQVKPKLQGASKSISQVRTEMLDAARIAIDRAVQMPVSRSSSGILSGVTQSPATPTIPCSVAETPNFKQRQSHLASLIQPRPSLKPPVFHNSSSKTAVFAAGLQTIIKSPQPSTKSPSVSQNSLFKTAVLAAGGREADPVSARSFRQAAKKAIHIIPGGSHLSPTNKIHQQTNVLMPPPPVKNPKSKETKGSSSNLQAKAGKIMGTKTSQSNQVAEGGDDMGLVRWSSGQSSEGSVDLSEKVSSSLVKDSEENEKNA